MTVAGEKGRSAKNPGLAQEFGKATIRFADLYSGNLYGAGEKERAFELWSKARYESATFLLYLRAWPANDSLRSEPRYEELLRGVGVLP
jgi:hypothetical protein